MITVMLLSTYSIGFRAATQLQDRELADVQNLRRTIDNLKSPVEKGFTIVDGERMAAALKVINRSDTEVIRYALVSHLAGDHADTSKVFVVLQYVFNIPANVDESDGPFTDAAGLRQTIHNWPLVFGSKGVETVRALTHVAGSYSTLSEFDRLRAAYGRRPADK